MIPKDMLTKTNNPTEEAGLLVEMFTPQFLT